MDFVLVAGPNGGGKTTLMRDLFPSSGRVDTDAIARALGPGDTRTDVVRAGRAALAQLERLMEEGRDVAFETTFSGRQPITVLRRARRDGYRIRGFYITLADADTHVARVRDRVAAGGHAVDEDVVRRRFVRSRENLLGHLDLFDELAVLDNTDEPRVIAALRGGRLGIAWDDHPLARALRCRLAAARRTRETT